MSIGLENLPQIPFEHDSLLDTQYYFVMLLKLPQDIPMLPPIKTIYVICKNMGDNLDAPPLRVIGTLQNEGIQMAWVLMRA